MKSRKTGTILLIVCAVLSLVDVALLVLFGVSGDNDYIFPYRTTILIMFFIMAGIICALYFLSRKFMSKVDGDVLERRRKYEALKVEEITDFKSELNETRENYAADKSADRNQFPEMGNGRGAYKKFYDKQVLTTGKIYYGCLVEANNALFKDDYSTLIFPAVFIYSTDEYFEEHPIELSAAADWLFANKNGNMLKNDFKWVCNEKINTPDGKSFYLSTIPTHRLALPSGYLTGRILPLIADPANCTSTFIVDPKYWSEKLISNFCNGEF